MKDWLAGLKPRERMLVYAAAAVIGLLLVYAMVISPLYSKYEKLVDSVDQQRETVQWMQQKAVTIRQLKGADPAAGQGLAGRSLLSVTDSEARTASLGPALKRVEPEGKDAVRVWLDGASFDALVGWLDVMSSRYAAEVDTITLERGEVAGLVNARLMLRAVGP